MRIYNAYKRLWKTVKTRATKLFTGRDDNDHPFDHPFAII